MKKTSLILFLLSVVFINCLTAQSAALSFTNPTIIGNKFRVSLHVASVGGSFGMGTNNLTFNYSTASLSNPVIISTVFAAPTFSSVTTTGSSLGIMRVNAAYSFITPPNTNAVPITAAGMDVAVIEFNYNPVANIALTWRIVGTIPNTVIADDDKITIRPVSHFSNSINFFAGIDKILRCDSDSITLMVEGGVPPYLWSNGSSTVTIKVKPSTTTAYSVMDSNGKKDTVNVIVLNDVYASDDVTLSCAVTTATLTAKCGGGNSYLWSNGETTASINVSPTVTTTYRVTATDGSSDEVKVTVFATVTANAGADVTVNCANYTTILQGTSNCSTCNFEWACVSSLNNVTINANNTNVTITTTNDNIARFKVTNPNTGCISLDYVNIHVDKTEPDITISNDVTVDCNAAQPLTLAATTNGYNLIWSNGATTNSITVSPTAQSVYSVTATNSNNGCIASKNVVISCTTTPNYVKVAMKAFLTGVDSTTLTMSDYIATLKTFPLKDPYAVNGAFYNNFTHVNNPIVDSITQFTLSTTGANAIVDWMFIELRKDSLSKPIVKTKAALIQADGDIVATDGFSPIQFDNVSFNYYYIVVRHRNHLGFRTLNPILLSNNTTSLDFTNNSIPLFGVFPTVALNSSISTMIGGDANSDGSIDALDSILWEQQNGLFNIIGLNADYNLDGSIDALDTIPWEINNGKFQELN